MKTLLSRFLYFLCGFIIASCDANTNDDKPVHAFHLTSEAGEFFRVTRVVDGDTFWVADGTKKGCKIRLIGIDAPESRKTFKKEIGHYGKEAKAYLEQLLTGKAVRLEYDVNKTDRYGRILAYAYLANGMFINAELVKNGYAQVMTVPPNIKYAELFLKMQRDAQKNRRGLWK